MTCEAEWHISKLLMTKEMVLLSHLSKKDAIMLIISYKMNITNLHC